MKRCYISLLVSNSKGFQNIIYNFECLKDYSQAKQLQTKVEEILLNISKILLNISCVV